MPKRKKIRLQMQRRHPSRLKGGKQWVLDKRQQELAANTEPVNAK